MANLSVHAVLAGMVRPVPPAVKTTAALAVPELVSALVQVAAVPQPVTDTVGADEPSTDGMVRVILSPVHIAVAALVVKEKEKADAVPEVAVPKTMAGDETTLAWTPPSESAMRTQRLAQSASLDAMILRKGSPPRTLR